MQDEVNVRQLFSLVLSAGGVQIMAAAVGIATIKIVAPYGSEVIAAVTGGQRLFLLIQAILLGLNVGSMAMVSASFGKSDDQSAFAWARASLLVSLAVTVPLTLIFFAFAEPILAVLGLQAESLRLGVDYIRNLSVFIFAIGLYLILAGALRAINITTIPLVCGVGMNILTILFAYYFVENAEFIGMTPAGAVAFAAGFGSLVGFLTMLALLQNKAKDIIFGPFPNGKSSQIWRISYPAILEQLIRQFSILAFLWVVAKYGEDAYAAYGAGIMLMAVSFVVGFGFSIATAVMVGQANGQNNPVLVGKVLNTSLLVSVGIMSVLGLVMGIYARELAVWLVVKGPVVEYTARFIFYFALVQPVMAADYVYVGALQGTGDTKWPMISVIVGPLLVRFTVAYLLLMLGFDLEWIFATIVMDYVVKTAIVRKQTYKRLQRMAAR